MSIPYFVVQEQAVERGEGRSASALSGRSTASTITVQVVRDRGHALWPRSRVMPSTGCMISERHSSELGARQESRGRLPDLLNDLLDLIERKRPERLGVPVPA